MFGFVNYFLMKTLRTVRVMQPNRIYSKYAPEIKEFICDDISIHFPLHVICAIELTFSIQKTGLHSN